MRGFRILPFCAQKSLNESENYKGKMILCKK